MTSLLKESQVVVTNWVKKRDESKAVIIYFETLAILYVAAFRISFVEKQ